MRYFFDTEFIENGKTIDLLSIGVVAEDGRTLYFENAEADKAKASQWVKDHVFPHLHECKMPDDPACDCPVRAKIIIKAFLQDFCDIERYGKPEFWGYYSAYDHVALCQLFGTMMDLPEGWPYYTRDFRQWLDDKGMQNIKQPDDAPHDALKDAMWIAETFKKQMDNARSESRAAKVAV